MSRALQEISARRSAAAKRGWETRRKRLGGTVLATVWDYEGAQRIVDQLIPPREPNPWPRFAATIKRFWHTATGWMR